MVKYANQNYAFSVHNTHDGWMDGWLGLTHTSVLLMPNH